MGCSTMMWTFWRKHINGWMNRFWFRIRKNWKKNCFMRSLWLFLSIFWKNLERLWKYRRIYHRCWAIRLLICWGCRLMRLFLWVSRSTMMKICWISLRGFQTRRPKSHKFSTSMHIIASFTFKKSMWGIVGWWMTSALFTWQESSKGLTQTLMWFSLTNMVTFRAGPRP